MPNTRINPPGLFDPTPYGYAHVVTALGGDLVFIAGQTAVDAGPDGKPAETGFNRQVEGAFTDLGIALKAAGLGFADVVHTTAYVVGLDPDRAGVVQDAARRTWGEHPPAQTVVGAAALAAPEAQFEIEAIAARS